MLSRRDVGSRGSLWSRVVALLPFALLVPAYVVSAKLCLRLAAEHPSATPVWAPTGIAIAATILLGSRVWPLIFVSAFMANVTTFGDVWSSVGIATGNTLEALLAAFLVQKYANGKFAFDNPMDAARYIVHAAILSTLVSASIGVVSLNLAGYADFDQFGFVWLTWWLGDATGALIVAPVILAWAAHPEIRWDLRRALEAAVIVTALIAITLLVFGTDPTTDDNLMARTYFCIPPIVWIGFRFYARVATMSVLAFATIVVYGSLAGLGPFGAFDAGVSLLSAQMLSGIIAMTCLVLSAATYEKSVREQALRESEGRFRALADSSPTMIWVADHAARWTFVNKTWLDFTRRALQELGTGWAESIHPDDLEPLIETYNASFEAKRSFRADVRLRRADGQYRWVMMTGSPQHDSAGNFSGYVGTCIDISERKKYEQELQLEAFRDPLTGLPNRALFLDRLNQSLNASRRREALGFAVLFLDIDRLKYLNDNFGHAAGDKLITETAKRIQGVLRPGDTVARLGGDEFAVLLEDVKDVHTAEAVARDIDALIRKPHWFDGEEFIATASIGIAYATGDDESAEAVLDDADAAMYRAKTQRRASMPHDAARSRPVDSMKLEAELRRALDRGEIDVHFQPIYEIDGVAIAGFEALVRWNHPERGLLLPRDFVSVAEQAGLIGQIDEFVLNRSCEKMAEWRRLNPLAMPMTVSVNFSAAHLSQVDIVSSVREALRRSGLDGSCLEIEIIEASFAEHSAHVARVLEDLRAMGVKLALDDFGTGYSSLGRLKDLPIDSIKLDRSFIANLDDDPSAREIAKAIIALAHVLDLKVTAEGVESEAEYVAVRDLGCELVQGFYFGRPVSGIGAEAFVHTSRAKAEVPVRKPSLISFRPLA
jgi:diguanylate cyclase (GGDEF)-like protein/PAS domain S-box-containing protein